MIFIYGAGVEDGETETPGGDLLYDSLRDSGYNDLSGLFSGSSSMYLHNGLLSGTAKYLRIKSPIAEQVNVISFPRQLHHARPNGRHFTALLQSAVRHTLNDMSSPFDVVKATRRDLPVSLCVESNLAHYLEIGHRAHLSPHKLGI